jgi:hypothetical protein
MLSFRLWEMDEGGTALPSTTTVARSRSVKQLMMSSLTLSSRSLKRSMS